MTHAKARAPQVRRQDVRMRWQWKRVLHDTNRIASEAAAADGIGEWKEGGKMERAHELIRVDRQPLAKVDQNAAVAHSVVPYNLTTGYNIVYIGHGKCIVPDRRGNQLSVYHIVTNQLQNVLSAEAAKEGTLSFPRSTPVVSRDFRYFCSCGIAKEGGNIFHAWDLESMQCIGTIERPDFNCHVFPDPQPALVYQLNGVLYRQSFGDPEARQVLGTGMDEINMLCMSRDGQRMGYTCYHDPHLYLMDVNEGSVRTSFDCRDLLARLQDGTVGSDHHAFFKHLQGYFTDNNRYLLLAMPEDSDLILNFCIIDVSTGRVKTVKTEKTDRFRRYRDALNDPFILDNSGVWLYADQTVIRTDTHQRVAVQLENCEKVLKATSFSREQAMHIRADILRVHLDAINEKVLNANDISFALPTQRMDSWLQIVMEDGFTYYTQTRPDIPKIQEIRHRFLPPVMETALGRLLELLSREKLRLDPEKVVIVVKSFPHSFEFMDSRTRAILCSVRLYRDGFVFFTEPDDIAPCGWLYTNRPDYLLVHEREGERCFMPGAQKREIHLGIHNRKDVIQNALLGEKDCLLELKDLKRLDLQRKEMIEKSQMAFLPGEDSSNPSEGGS